jgi:AAA+ ATPase superfamily predicted ATPase
MKTPKLIKMAQSYLDNDAKKATDQRACIKEILKKLKKKKQALKSKLDKVKSDKERKRIERDLCIIYEQRKKGLKLLKRHPK